MIGQCASDRLTVLELELLHGQNVGLHLFEYGLERGGPLRPLIRAPKVVGDGWEFKVGIAGVDRAGIVGDLHGDLRSEVVLHVVMDLESTAAGRQRYGHDVLYQLSRICRYF